MQQNYQEQNTQCNKMAQKKHPMQQNDQEQTLNATK